MNKMILIFLCINTYSHSALNILRTRGVALRTGILRSSCVPLHKRIIRAQHNLTTTRTDNLPNRQAPSQPPAHTGAKNVQHSFETADNTPMSVAYNPTGFLSPGNYRFAPFHHFATFRQRLPQGNTYIYVGSEDPIEEDSIIGGEICTKKIAIEKKEISEHFSSLSFNIQTMLKKDILVSAYCYSNSKSILTPSFTIKQMLKELDPVLRIYYENCIIDLATNKPSLSPFSISVKSLTSLALYDKFLVTKVATYITAKESATKSFISQTFKLLEQAPSRVINGIKAITAGSSTTQTPSSQTDAPTTQIPAHTLLQITSSASPEQIKEAYHTKRFEAESRKDDAAVQALAEAYNKLKK